MRVISGVYKGRRLKTVKDLSVRPATDRVKQTLFDMLATRLDLDDAQVLDLFAGSGGLGIEALSRGAAHATFVEDDADAASYLEQNLSTLGCNTNSTVWETDAMSFVHRCDTTFDLIFADPPYKFPQTASIPELVFRKPMLHRHGYLLIEHSKDLRFESNRWYTVASEKTFGRTLVTFFRHPQEQDAA